MAIAMMIPMSTRIGDHDGSCADDDVDDSKDIKNMEIVTVLKK